MIGSPTRCRWFGTDGVRDVAGQGLLSAEAVRRWGEAIGAYLSAAPAGSPTVWLGRDSRASGGWIAAALRRALERAGLAVRDAGVCTTPMVSWLVRRTGARAGVVVSASHNPAEYNGLKVFDGRGGKLSPEEERKIEEAWESSGDAAGEQAQADPVPALASDERDAFELYRAGVRSFFDGLDLRGMRVVLDCASGAAHRIAPLVYEAFGAEVLRIDPAPDGGNINRGGGALHPERLRDAVRQSRAAVGLAFDGDADRLMVVDAGGAVRDGDDLLWLVGPGLAAKGRLPGNTVVGTVLSSLALDVTLADRGLRVLRCDVGDRNVSVLLEREGAALGGEPSGHVIHTPWGPTGDGIVSGLILLSEVREAGRSLHELLAPFVKFPRIEMNVPVRAKPPLDTLPTLRSARVQAAADLGSTGRVVLRYSGTEPLFRVFVEGPDRAQCERWAARLADAATRDIG